MSYLVSRLDNNLYKQHIRRVTTTSSISTNTSTIASKLRRRHRHFTTIATNVTNAIFVKTYQDTKFAVTVQW